MGSLILTDGGAVHLAVGQPPLNQLVAAIRVDEWTNPPAASTAALQAPTASANGTQTVTVFLAGGLTELATRARNGTVTIAGGTPAQGPTAALWTGKDVKGNVQTETVVLSGAGTYSTVKAYAGPTQVQLTGGTGVDATVALGYGNLFGLSQPIRDRAGRPAVLEEVVGGFVRTDGTYVDGTTSAPNGTYTSTVAPDGTKSYAITYEQIVP